MSTQELQTTNPQEFTDLSAVPATGRIIALDPGTKRIGVAICDELRVTTRPLETFERRSWKKLVAQARDLIAKFDAGALVIGLPLASNGDESEMSIEARRWARNLSLSLAVPVFLQDERVTSYEAKGRLWERGLDVRGARKLVDSEAAAIILGDFLDRLRVATSVP